MRKYVIAIALAAAFYIDTVLFGVCGSPVFWPNTVLAVIAALSVMGGGCAVCGGRHRHRFRY